MNNFYLIPVGFFGLSLFSVLFYNNLILLMQFLNILYLKNEGCLLTRTVLVVVEVNYQLLNQPKFDLSFEIFLVFLLLFLGFLNLTQKSEGTNDLSISFFMPLQIDFTPNASVFIYPVDPKKH